MGKPKNVRNFWVTVEVDGRENTFKTGPRSADGGMIIRIQQRENGDIGESELIIRCAPNSSSYQLVTSAQVFKRLPGGVFAMPETIQIVTSR